MLGVVFFVTVVTVLAGHYILVGQRREKLATGDLAPRPLPLKELIDRQPAGVFLQPTFTWSRVRPAGDVELGVHPLLSELLGPGATKHVRAVGEHVDRGDPLLGIQVGDHTLALRSPFSGRILMADERPPRTPGWRSVVTRDGGWTYVVKPDHLSEEVPEWMVADSARDWTRDQYRSIRDHLMLHAGDPGSGLALADGGELPVGALDQLDSEGWKAFEAEFLIP